MKYTRDPRESQIRNSRQTAYTDRTRMSHCFRWDAWPGPAVCMACSHEFTPFHIRITQCKISVRRRAKSAPLNKIIVPLMYHYSIVIYGFHGIHIKVIVFHISLHVASFWAYSKPGSLWSWVLSVKRPFWSSPFVVLGSVGGGKATCKEQKHE